MGRAFSAVVWPKRREKARFEKKLGGEKPPKTVARGEGIGQRIWLDSTSVQGDGSQLALSFCHEDQPGRLSPALVRHTSQRSSRIDQLTFEKGITPMNRNRVMLTMTFALMVVSGALLVVAEAQPWTSGGKPSMSVASRYPMRGRTPDFYARSKASTNKKSCGR